MTPLIIVILSLVGIISFFEKNYYFAFSALIVILGITFAL
jgi:hypothetical protein